MLSTQYCRQWAFRLSAFTCLRSGRRCLYADMMPGAVKHGLNGGGQSAQMAAIEHIARLRLAQRLPVFGVRGNRSRSAPAVGCSRAAFWPPGTGANPPAIALC